MTKRERITRDYLGGMSVREVAEKYGRTPGGVQTSLWQWGVKLSAEERSRRHSASSKRLHRVSVGRHPIISTIPEHLRDDFRILRKYYSGDEARRILCDQTTV